MSWKIPSSPELLAACHRIVTDRRRPRTFGIAADPFGAIIAWIIAAAGVYTLARAFQLFAERKRGFVLGKAK